MLLKCIWSCGYGLHTLHGTYPAEITCSRVVYFTLFDSFIWATELQFEKWNFMVLRLPM